MAATGAAAGTIRFKDSLRAGQVTGPLPRRDRVRTLTFATF